MLDALRGKQISSAELTELHIGRIQRHDAALNAVVVRDFDRARSDARAADESAARGEAAALLGLPMTLKESINVAGLPTTCGVPEWAGFVSSWDAPATTRVRSAGAVLLGKTNVPPMLADWQSANPIYGRTNNPWDRDRTPGGSTGGGSAAVAAGLTPLEVGSDIGGSIRVPAVFCGIYGHRPSDSCFRAAASFRGLRRPTPPSGLVSRARSRGARRIWSWRSASWPDRTSARTWRGAWSCRRRGRPD